MAITVTDISSLIDRFGNEVVHEQASLAAPILDIMEKHKSPSVGIVNVKAGGIDSTAMIADGGTLTTAASKDLEQLSYTPVSIFSRLSIPRVAAATAVGQGDGVNLVQEQLETVGGDMGRQLGRAIIGSSLATIDGTQATELGAGVNGSNDSITMASVAEYRVGQIVERRASDTSLEEYMRVTQVVPDADGIGGTVYLDRDIDTSTDNAAPANGDVFYLQGGYSNAMVSLEDVSAAASLYGKAQTADDWSGNLISSVGALALTDLRQATTLSHRRSGSAPSFGLCSPAAAMLIGDLQVGVRRFAPGDKLDYYEKGPAAKVAAWFEGMPMYLEPNCKDSDIHLVNSKDQKIHEFVAMGVDRDGAGHSSFGPGNVGAGRSGLLISQSTLTYDAQFWGSYNLRVQRRNSHVRLTGITNS